MRIGTKLIKAFEIVGAILGLIIGVIYYPIYCAAWLLHKILRFLLALCYFAMFRKCMAVDIITNLFKHE